MITIENQHLRVSIAPKGAELQSVLNKSNGLDYLWSADPAYWAKHSPVLFPIVGTLRENRYQYKGQYYTMGRHGFARDRVFEVEKAAADAASFVLRDDAQTREQFPFAFVFEIRYTLNDDQLYVTYHVTNPGKEDLYFSVGGHPAFRVPLEAGLAYDDYYLLFNATEDAGRWPISKDGLIEPAPVSLLNNTNRLSLTKALFAKDALVFKGLRSTAVQLKSDKGKTGLSFAFEGFPFLGIWAAPGADFICIEPWCGIADSVDASQHIEEKEGIEKLSPGADFSRSWSIRLF